LRARAGKLKSIKIGRKWMTTKNWVDDYVLQSKEWNEKMVASRMKKDAAIRAEGDNAKAPNIALQPAKTYSLPQIEFASLNNPAMSIPKPAKTINYSSPRFLFVLGSGAMLALLLFVWMSAGFNAGGGTSIGAGQANIAQGIRHQQSPGGPADKNLIPADGFEYQLDPQVLGNALNSIEAGQTTAAVSQLEMPVPVINGKSN
jgi:hypothetical protein